MLIEFRNCSLEIGYMGTDREIFRSVLRDCAQESIDRFCETYRPIFDEMSRLWDNMPDEIKRLAEDGA